jgi:sulfur carrier protein ThiS
MIVEVHLHTTLRMKKEERKGRVVAVELPESSTMNDLLLKLDIRLDPVHMLFVHNGRTSNPNQILEDGDVVNIMTAVTGG